MKPFGSYLIAAAAAAALAGCGQRAAPVETRPVSEAEKAGYVQAPRVDRVVAVGGGVVLHGQARPGERVRATAASGAAYGATADDRGRFALQIPAQAGPLFAKVAAVEGQRVTQAEGWVFVPPGDVRRVAVLRPGAPSTVIDTGAPLIAAFDYDGGGGAAVSGQAAANAEVRLSLDGAPRGSVRADAAGRYGFRLSQAPAGARLLRVVSGEHSQERTVVLTTPAPGQGAAVVRDPDAWRVDWSTPAGGAQSTLLFTDGPTS